MDSAGAAERRAAAELGAGHAEDVAEDPQNRSVAIDVNGPNDAVYLDIVQHALPPGAIWLIAAFRSRVWAKTWFGLSQLTVADTLLNLLHRSKRHVRQWPVQAGRSRVAPVIRLKKCAMLFLQNHFDPPSRNVRACNWNRSGY